MRLSVCLDPARPWADALTLAVHAETVGLHGVWACDHFMPSGEDGHPVAGPVLEGWTVLTAVAARTTRIRLGTLVLGAAHRHPAVVAKMAATLDHVSDGRLTLGLGAGWQPNEHTAYGIELLPPPARLGRFAEYVAAIRSLLREPRTTVAGEWFRRAGPEERRARPALWRGRPGPRGDRAGHRWRSRAGRADGGHPGAAGCLGSGGRGRVRAEGPPGPGAAGRVAGRRPVAQRRAGCTRVRLPASASSSASTPRGTVSCGTA